MEQFAKDISSAITTPTDDVGVSDFTSQYNKSLASLLNKHAPKKTRVMKSVNTPWYTPELRAQKTRKRRLEKRYKRSKSGIDKIAYKEACHSYYKLLKNTRSKYYNAALTKCGTNQRAIYKTLQQVLPLRDRPSYPRASSNLELANRFNRFFINKIKTIIAALNKSPVQHRDDITTNIDTKLTCFDPTSPDEISKIIAKSPSKTCRLDPLPTSVVKSCKDELSPFISKLINVSLQSGELPVKKLLLLPS